MEKQKIIESKKQRKATVKVTSVPPPTYSSTAAIVVNRGGSSSSKSYSVAQVLLERFLSPFPRKILMLRKTLPSLRTSVYPLIQELLDAYEVTDRVFEEKQLMNLHHGKDKLIKVLQGLLDTKEDLDFLLELKTEDIEKLVAIVRDKVKR